jgi:hypothetical protein
VSDELANASESATSAFIFFFEIGRTRRTTTQLLRARDRFERDLCPATVAVYADAILKFCIFRHTATAQVRHSLFCQLGTELIVCSDDTNQFGNLVNVDHCRKWMSTEMKETTNLLTSENRLSW